MAQIYERDTLSEENWRYRTLSKLETLFHVANARLDAGLARDGSQLALNHLR